MSLESWQWALALLAAFIVGFSKTGIGGLSMLAVALFNVFYPSTKVVSGLVLPLLIVGDLVAVKSYHRHIRWPHLVKLFPWTVAGVVLGWFALGRINDRQASVLVGAIIVSMVAMQLWRRRGRVGEVAEQGAWLAPLMGVLAGFTTLVANAAGPLMAMYLIAMRLPKMEFVGTAAVFFMILNWFKVPFMVQLGLITEDTVIFDLKLVPAVLAGAWIGRWILPKVNQGLFETLALALSFLAGLRMIVG